MSEAKAMKRRHPSRVAIVTGVGAGIGGVGRGIAARLLREGMCVMAADVDPAVEQVIQDIAQAQGIGPAGVAWFAGDLGSESQVQAMTDRVMARWGRIDVLVNNAGSGVIRPFLEHDAASLAATFNRNLWTTVWCCHKVLPHMVEADHGRIINIGADSLRTGIPNHAGYNAAKGGVVGLMVGLAREFAQHDITVNTVSPCVINTKRHRDALAANKEVTKEFVRVVPKGRGVEIYEVCDMVAFLARQESAFMTGQDISLNGGSAMP